jgi:hypothetical protein
MIGKRQLASPLKALSVVSRLCTTTFANGATAAEQHPGCIKKEKALPLRLGFFDKNKERILRNFGDVLCQTGFVTGRGVLVDQSLIHSFVDHRDRRVEQFSA